MSCKENKEKTPVRAPPVEAADNLTLSHKDVLTATEIIFDPYYC